MLYDRVKIPMFTFVKPQGVFENRVLQIILGCKRKEWFREVEKIILVSYYVLLIVLSIAVVMSRRTK